MNQDIGTKAEQPGPSFVEFVLIISLMISITALSTDAMLPALPQIGSELSVRTANDRQLVVTALFLGLALGQWLFGPLSDKTGRKPAVYAGYSLFIAGALLSAFAASFPMMLAGWLFQGLGLSAPRPLPWLWCAIDTRAGRWPG